MKVVVCDICEKIGNDTIDVYNKHKKYDDHEGWLSEKYDICHECLDKLFTLYLKEHEIDYINK